MLLDIEATVPMVEPPCVPMIEPTESWVKNEVPEPVTVVEFVAAVTVPVRLMLAEVQVAAAFQLPPDAVLDICASASPTKNNPITKKSKEASILDAQKLLCRFFEKVFFISKTTLLKIMNNSFFPDRLKDKLNVFQNN